MDATGWLLKNLDRPETAQHAHPLIIVATIQEAMSKEPRISHWHTASTVHDNPTIHAYYNSFDPGSTRWIDDNKGNPRRGIIANMTADQRRQVILSAQAAHNAPSSQTPERPVYQEPLKSHFSDSDLPPVPPSVPSLPPPSLPQVPSSPSNGKPSGDELAALKALAEEGTKMTALALKATVETRQSLNAHRTETSANVDELRAALAAERELREQSELRAVALTERVDELASRTPRETIIRIQEPGKLEQEIKTGRHAIFPKLLKYAKALREGSNGIWLTGGAGTGKTTLARHIAEATDRAFRLQGAITAKHDLLGYMDAQGRYVGTPFHDAFKNGHLCLLDEVDASFPAGTLAIQAAISNQVCQFPYQAEPVVMHPKFQLFCAANTTGQGSDALYSGRTKQDAAFLDRFTKVHVNYDEDWELSVTPESMKAFTKAVHQVRANVAPARSNNRGQVQGASAQIIISIRSIMQGIDLITGTDISAVEIMDDIYRTPYGNVNTFDTLFAPVYEFAREFDRKNQRS